MTARTKPPPRSKQQQQQRLVEQIIVAKSSAIIRNRQAKKQSSLGLAMAVPPMDGGLGWVVGVYWMLRLNLLLLILQTFLVTAVTANDDDPTAAASPPPPPYQEVIVTFDQTMECQCSMFPAQEQWEWILNDSLARVGVTDIRWTHGCLDGNNNRRELQDDAGCPDWCQYLKQYCDCGCVTTCDEDDDGGSRRRRGRHQRYLLRQQQQQQGHYDGELLLEAAQEEFDNLQKQHMPQHRHRHRRTGQVAQFILDEQTAEYYLEFNIEHMGVTVDCLRQYEDHYKARVYLI